jgi:transcriptional regulator with XRE-family HTH domain
MARGRQRTRSRESARYAKEVGTRLQQARLAAGGMTQAELALLVGLKSDRSVISWESGVNVAWLDKISEALNISRGWLLHGDDFKDGSEQDDALQEILKLLKEVRKDVRALKAADR